MSHGEDPALVVSQINRFIQENEWFDFFIEEFTPYRLLLKGGIDLTDSVPDLIIEFRDVFFLESLMHWQTDTTRPPMSILSDDASAPLRIKYQMGSENTVFGFEAEHYEPGVCVIAARSVNWSSPKAQP